MGGRREHPPLVSQVGARIRLLRLERGLSTKTLGQRSGLWPSHLEGIELGRISPNVVTVRAIAEALKVQPFDLLNCDTTSDHGALVEDMRHWNPTTVRKMLVVIRDRLGNLERGSVRPGLASGRPPAPRTSAPSAAC
ncbi:helix-turn-helix domain-containing protein [Polyangium fumosum]|uniref:Helix-turn-helix domain-containing protein n=1 Tax=Polyangium fumosum TaxID=889272 RepID=A0A4U1IKT7_9BACT|nr:helix-turn-helix transcriptional regulator [Polyangium fumosum]TKC94574.1 helix-turn-helix domain-containing protein [Polyangium fumosum]